MAFAAARRCRSAMSAFEGKADVAQNTANVRLRPKAHIPGLASAPSRLVQRLVLSNDYMGADRHTVIKVSHVVIDQAEATGRDGLPDRFRRVGAVDAVHSGAKIHCARSERIARAAGHEARQIGLALDHFRWRMPVWPLGLARDL